MKRTIRRQLVSGAIMGGAVVSAALLARFAGGSRGSILAGPALLALATVGVDLLESRLRGSAARPSWPALILGGSFLLAGAIAMLRGTPLVLELLPIFAGGASVAVLAGGRRSACGPLPGQSRR
jgi:hypothetical protein